MKQTRTFFLSFGLILLALLCSCDKSVQTDADVTMAKARKRAMVQPSELGNFVVNPDLDAEFQVSEAEIVEELISYGFLNTSESVEITPIYSERIIPLFFKSLIVEPESNEWYGINVDEVMDMYLEFPSIAFYIINTTTEKSFLTTADKRFDCNIVRYLSPDYLDPEIITVQENLINELYESGDIMPKHRWDSIWIADYRYRTGLNISDDRFELKVCYWQLVSKNMNPIPSYECEYIGITDKHSILSEDLRWGQEEIFGDCDHNLKTGSMVLSILKILYLSNYSGILLDESFDSSVVVSDMNILSYFAWKIYYYIEFSPLIGGIIILANCGIYAQEANNVHMRDIRDQIYDGKVVLAEDNGGNWLLICGYKKKESTCFSVYLYDYDFNQCEHYTNSWGCKVKRKQHYFFQ